MITIINALWAVLRISLNPIVEATSRRLHLVFVSHYIYNRLVVSQEGRWSARRLRTTDGFGSPRDATNHTIYPRYSRGSLGKNFPKWRSETELNRQPPVYKTGVLPLNYQTVNIKEQKRGGFRPLLYQLYLVNRFRRARQPRLLKSLA